MASIIIIIAVLLGALLLWHWHEHEISGAALEALDGRAVGLQAGVQAGDTATVRWPSWTPEPSNTPRVYPSWTPLPTRTPRYTATTMPTPTFSPPTATLPTHSTHTPQPTATLPPKGCEEPWPFSYNERQNIAAAARNHLWQGAREEPQVAPQEDALLSIGLFAAILGAPLTDEYHLLPDDGEGYIRCRAFALGVVALRERADIDETCRNWSVVSWGGEPTDR